jgi:predicted phosphate transport protein (TIGR00153 family)
VKIIGLKEWIIPNDKHFFNMLENESQNVLDGSIAFLNMLKKYENIEEKQQMIKDIEHQGDDFVHEIFEELNKTFITPIDHEDISKLASALDDVLDNIDGSATRFVLYDLQRPEENMIKIAEVLLQQITELRQAISGLHKIKNAKDIEERCIEVNRLENVADDLYKTSVAGLFKRKDAIEIMKLKEVYERLEFATDKCEDAANVISDIVVKNS